MKRPLFISNKDSLQDSKIAIIMCIVFFFANCAMPIQCKVFTYSNSHSNFRERLSKTRKYNHRLPTSSAKFQLTKKQVRCVLNHGAGCVFQTQTQTSRCGTRGSTTMMYPSNSPPCLNKLIGCGDKLLRHPLLWPVWTSSRM